MHNMANKKTIKKRRLQRLKQLLYLYNTEPGDLTNEELRELKEAGYISTEERP